MKYKEDKCAMCAAHIIAGHKTCACVEVSKVPQISTDVCRFIRSKLEGDDYERGAVESARAQADNASLLLERLVGLLMAKSIVTKDEINHITKSFYPGQDL